jgi:hypothetical protein
VDTLELTQAIAYRIYELRGRSDGHQLEDWVAAERLIQDVTRLWTPPPVALEAAPPLVVAPAPAPSATTVDPAIASSVRLSRLETTVVVAPPRRAKPATAPELAPAGVEKEALAALERAVARRGRAAVAACLGWSSTGPVAALLRGDRAVDRALAARILAAFAPEADARAA